MYSHARGSQPDRACLNSHSLIRGVLEHALNFFEDGITRRLSARGWGQDTARCAGDITIVVCKKKEHTLLCALSFWNRHRHTLPGPRRFRLIRRRRTSLAAPPDTARAPSPLALWRAIVSSSTAPLPFARRLSARGWGQDTARCAGDIAIVACKKEEHTLLCALPFWNRHRHTLPGRVQPSTICADELNSQLHS